MDTQAANLLATLKRTSAPPEQKLTLLSNIKSDIKHYRVPENAQATIFECLKLSISSQTSINLVTAALSTLGHLIKRLKIQDPEGRAITNLAPRLWPCLQERLGDPRDSHRAGAQQAFMDLYPYCATDVEHIIRDEAISGHNTRAKEMGMQWVARMHDEHALPFKSFVPAMVVCLEDADGMVRDAAKGALVDLFRTASTPAKNDLKKQLKVHAVRQSIASQILAQIGVSDRPAPDVDLAASTRSLPAIEHISHFSESINSDEAKPPPVEEVPMDPIFVHSRQELEDIFRDMMPHFEGRESEDNWLFRDKDITKLRRLTRGNAPSDYHGAYMAGIKQLQEGTLKVANSLRTTMMTNGCLLAQDLARTLGPAIDSMVETYLQNFIKMCAATKSIQVQNGNQTVDTIFQYVSYNVKLMHHVWLAAQDKNKAPRTFSAGWLRTILSRQAGSRTHFEHTGGLDLAEKTIKKCLTDADPKVKESMRATYWAYAKLWPERAETMINAFDDKVRAALERDSHNPNAAKVQSSFSQSTNSRASGARSALRDRIAAAKREKAQPSRPNTSMGTMSPAKSKSMANLSARAKAMGPPTSSARIASNASVASTATVDSVSSTSSTATMRPNSLMSGAARRPVKRPEISRPATADPYSARKMLRPETPSNSSPNRSPRQSTSTKPTTAQSTIARNRIGRGGSPAASPLRNNTARPATTSRPTSKDVFDHSEDSGRLNGEDLTMVLPSAITRQTASSAAKQRPALDTAQSYDTAVQGLGIEDNFTLEMPSLQTSSSHNAHRERPLSSHRSPARHISEEGNSAPAARSSRSSLRVGSPQAAASPSSNRAKSPLDPSPSRRDTPQTETKPPSRHGSPLKQSSAPEEPEVKIYEDPFNATQPAAPSHPQDEPPQVLTELPVNETSPPAPASPPHPALSEPPISPPQSPQSKAERLRSRKLLQSGISRIRARTLDTHGFRKVLELTRTHSATDLFGTSDAEEDGEGVPSLYNDLLAALCDFVATAPGSTPALDRPNRMTGEVKRQAFGVMRALLRGKTYRAWNEAGGWFGKCLGATLRGRRYVEGTGMVVKDVETLCADVAAVLGPRDVVETCAAFLEEQKEVGGEAAFRYPESNGVVNGEKNESKAASQASALGLRCVMNALVFGGQSEEMSNGHVEQGEVGMEQRTRVAGLVATFLRAKDAEVRKAAVECATELYVAWPAAGAHGDVNGHHDGDVNGTNGGSVGIVTKAMRDKEGFWAALESEKELNDSTKNLLVYFVTRREGRVEGR